MNGSKNWHQAMWRNNTRVYFTILQTLLLRNSGWISDNLALRSFDSGRLDAHEGGAQALMPDNGPNHTDRSGEANLFSRVLQGTLCSLCFILFLWSGQVFAAQACRTASITAITPTTDFVDNGNGTVTHTKTGLMWKRCSEGQVWSGATCTGTAAAYTWQGALQQAQASNNVGGFATFTDWRLPNQKELKSIVEKQCMTPAINTTIFPATFSAGYWSASPYAGFATDAWNVYFGNGYDFAYAKSDNLYVRLVRGGQRSKPGHGSIYE